MSSYSYILHLCIIDIGAATRRNRIFALAKTKTQISFAVISKLISAFVFATRIVQFLYFLNPKFQASSHLRNCTGQFVSDMVVNSEDRFSRVAAHIYYPYFKHILGSVGCHDILMLGRSPMKWRQRPDMTIAVDCVAK